MKLEELRGETLRSFVQGMRKERLHGEAFRAFLESNLEFARWGFHLSHMTYGENGAKTKVIYDSDRCRVRFDLHNIGRLPEEDELHVQYGRRHAPNDNVVMVWRGERCRCWHYSVPAPVLFVEGNSPRDIFAHRKKEGDYPYPHALVAKNESEQDREFRNLYPPACVVWREVLIWQHCGHRFFDLFDLRRPELWEDYQKFIHEYYVEYERVFPPKRVGGDPALPRDRICYGMQHGRPGDPRLQHSRPVLSRHAKSPDVHGAARPA